jgi:hypothetical protein
MVRDNELNRRLKRKYDILGWRLDVRFWPKADMCHVELNPVRGHKGLPVQILQSSGIVRT